MPVKGVFKVWVVKYWLSEGVFESYATEGHNKSFVYLCEANGERTNFYGMKRGRDVVDTKEEAKELVHSLAAKKVRSLAKQQEKVLERAKNPWRKK